MKRDNINYLAVGIFVLTAFGVLLYALSRITGGVGENDAYYVFYRNVGGLAKGTPVTYEGFKVGFVKSITPSQAADGTRYRVDLRIRDGWQIPEDSVARVYAEGLLAEIVVNIEEGSSGQFLPPGSELAGRQGVDVFAALADLADQVGGLTSDSIRPLLDNLNHQVTTVGGEVSDRLPRILEGMETLVVDLGDSATRLNTLLGDENQQKLERVINNTDQMALNLLELSEGLAEMRSQADGLLVESNTLVTENREDVRASIHALRRSLDDVAAYSQGILRNMEGASRNMNEFSRQIRDNPGILLGGKPPKDRGVSRD